MIYVTHDQIEALTLADRIAVMHEGVIQQLATPHEIYRRPVNLYVAGFVGSPSMNFLEGRLTSVNGAPGIKLTDGTDVSLAGYEFAGTPGDGRRAVLGVRAEQIVFSGEANGSSLPVTVALIDPMGSDNLVWGTVGEVTVAVRIGAEDTYSAGQTLQGHFHPAQVSLFDAESGDRI
jgi:multiple sugar transport system ATP-binding protein